ncbi:hypothetical protein ABK040_011623 [Willaertia magna]
MKRHENPLFPQEKQEPQQKKLMPTTQPHQLHYSTITNLNDDEFQIVLSFLNISGILFLSLTCKEIYQQIYEIIKQRHPILYSSLSSPKNKEWSITRAFIIVIFYIFFILLRTLI